MKCRSLVEVFDIVKEYHYLYKEGGDNHMCIAALDAFRDGRISKREEVSLVNLIEDEMQRYADFYIPRGNNFKVDECTTLFSVIVETIKFQVYYNTLGDGDRDDGVIIKMAEEFIPIWWDAFYEKLRLTEEYGNDKYYCKQDCK